LKDKKNQQQNLVSSGYFQKPDLNERVDEIISEIAKETSFKPIRLLGKSGWWGSKTIGAFHYKGKFNDKNCILKVQGTKLPISEVYNIESFAKQNKSNLVRPPHLYKTISWSDKKRYEALIMEDVGNKKIISVPTNNKEVDLFFKLLLEYRNNCRNKPWINKPKEISSKMITVHFNKWRKASKEIYKTHVLRDKEDDLLIDRAIKVLTKGYHETDLEFQHGHFGDADIYKVGKQYILLSNLYWSWRPPFYDAIFGYHWFRYHLVDVKNITENEVEKQKNLWLTIIDTLPYLITKRDKLLLKLALLERATAALNLDALSIDTKAPISKYLVISTREEVKDLLKDLSNT